MINRSLLKLRAILPSTLPARARIVRAGARRELAAAVRVGRRTRLADTARGGAAAREPDRRASRQGRRPPTRPTSRHGALANLAGVPGISVPVGLSEGLPAGLQLLASMGRGRRASGRRGGARARNRPRVRQPEGAGPRLGELSDSASSLESPDGCDRERGARAGVRGRDQGRRRSRSRGRRGRDLRLPRPQRRRARRPPCGCWPPCFVPPAAARGSPAIDVVDRARRRCAARSASPSRRRPSTR